MAAFMPWALLRLVPLAELASSAAGPLRREFQRDVGGAGKIADASARKAEDFLGHMRDEAQQAWPAEDVAAGGPAGYAARTSAAAGEDPPSREPSSEGARAQSRPTEATTTGDAPPDAADENPRAQAASGDENAAPQAASGASAGAANTTPERHGADAAQGPRATEGYGDSDLLDAEPYRRRMWYGVPDGPSFTVEPAGDDGRQADSRDVVPGPDRSHGDSATAGSDADPATRRSGGIRSNGSAATDQADPLPPRQEDPEGRL